MDLPSTHAGARVLVDRYVLSRVMGAGGAGVVWRAHDRVLDRAVAVKLLHPEVARDAATASRFKAEAAAAAKLTHPNAVVVYDIGRDGDDDYLVMEFVEGATLADVLTLGPLPPGVVASLGAQIGRALGVAHAQGLVHRDVKPANVLITRDGVAKVADFGIARALGEATSRLTTPGHIMGTARYLAPEQLRDHTIDARADVYALGLVLHEALTGAPPFGEGTVVELASRRLVGELGRVAEHLPDVPASLDDAIARSTRLDPEDRFVDGAQLAVHLARAITADAPRTLAERVEQVRVARAAAASEDPARPQDGAAVLAAEDRGEPVRADRDVSADAGWDGLAGADRAAIVATPDGDVEVVRSDQQAAAPAEDPGATAALAPGLLDAPVRDAVHGTPPSGREAGEPDLAATAAIALGPPGPARPAAGGVDGGAAAQDTTGALGAELDPTPDRLRRVGGVALLAVLVVGAVVAAATLFGDRGPSVPGDGSDASDSTDLDPSGTPVALDIVDGGDHDPHGSGQEHSDAVPNAFDDNLGTRWQTQRYRGNPQLGGLKPGVGIWLDVGASHQLDEVVVTTDDPGADLTIYVGDAPPEPGVTPAEWGTVAATIEDAAAEARAELDEGTEGRVVLLWFTSLPPDGGEFRATVAEVAILGL